MHYVGVVFTREDSSVEDALAPFEEMEREDGTLDGEWDWWVEGGRWEGSQDDFESGDRIPYFFLTLDGEWNAKEEYIPEGYPDEGHGYGTPKRSYFRDIPNYDERYLGYLKSVPEGTVVTVVDIHR